MANSVDPDQTAPIGAVCSGSMMISSILNLSVMLIVCSRGHQQATFSDAFFLGALRVNIIYFHPKGFFSSATNHMGMGSTYSSGVLCRCYPNEC